MKNRKFNKFLFIQKSSTKTKNAADLFDTLMKEFSEKKKCSLVTFEDKIKNGK